MPVFPVPDGHDPASWLRHEVEDGLRSRFPDALARRVLPNAPRTRSK